MSIHDDCTGYDLAAGVATGLRAFDVDELGRLRGVHHARIWRPGENVARCNQKHFDPTTGATRPVEPGRCDDESHGCGFWAYHDGSEYHAGKVHGVIEGYGKTTVGTKGFRAEKARVVALAIPRKNDPEVTRESRWDRYCRWADRHTNWAVPLAFLFLFAGSAAFGFVTTASDPILVVGLIVVGLLAVGAFLATVRATFRGVDLHYAHRVPMVSFNEAASLSDDLAAKVRRNYPDVKFYDSVKAMKEAHPVDKALEPTPDNDPRFWEEVDEPASPVAWGGVTTPTISAYQDAMRKFDAQIQAATRWVGGRP